jgi:hypothetical protein
LNACGIVLAWPGQALVNVHAADVAKSSLAVTDILQGNAIIYAYASSKAILAGTNICVWWYRKLCMKAVTKVMMRIMTRLVVFERTRFHTLSPIEARSRCALVHVNGAVGTAKSIQTCADIAVYSKLDGSC